MTQALLVAVRFHEGRYHGSDDWPPAPGRLFQALMAGAAKGASLPTVACDALDWLERLAPPVIAAPRGALGRDYVTYVPNNDLDAELGKREVPSLFHAVAAIRVAKSVCPVLFDSDKPVLYRWILDESESENAKTVCGMANNLYRLGHGIDMAWAEAAVIAVEDSEEQLSNHGGIIYRPNVRGRSGRDLFCPRPGLRQSLSDRFDGMRNRFRTGENNSKPSLVFVQPPKPLLTKIVYNAVVRRYVFELRESGSGGGFASWPLDQAARLVTEARDKAETRLSSAGLELSENIERYLIGRGAADIDKSARVRIVPIPSVGHEHVNMTIRRLALYVPPACPVPGGDLAWAFSQVAWLNSDGVIERELQSGGHDDRMVARFERRGRRWRSVTPLVLPTARRRRIEPARIETDVKGGQERANEEARAAVAVRRALHHAGVSVPVADVRVQREPFDRRGARAEAFAIGTRFPKEVLWHAAITFTEPVKGPVILGDGRYLGLGLMLTDERMHDIVAFAIENGLGDKAEAAAVARAARRAMMARVQQSLGPQVSLPTYVTGHKEGGGPADDGNHRHVAVVADLPRRRIFYIAPTRLQRGDIRWGDIAINHRLMANALEGLSVLRAGAAGRLELAPITLNPASDPLFATARVWESVTEYDVTRYHRRLTDEDALKLDIAAELRRRGWPSPETIEVLVVGRGPRGGLVGRLRLTFAAAQSGPLLIGKSAHKGGGLFAKY